MPPSPAKYQKDVTTACSVRSIEQLTDKIDKPNAKAIESRSRPIKSMPTAQKQIAKVSVMNSRTARFNLTKAKICWTNKTPEASKIA